MFLLKNGFHFGDALLYMERIKQGIKFHITTNDAVKYDFIVIQSVYSYRRSIANY